MEQFKGTQGPWEPVVIHGICIGVAKATDGPHKQVICNSILPDTDKEYLATKDSIDADMRLIAAAPDAVLTLGNAKKALEYIGSSKSISEDDFEWFAEIVKEADEVLNKVIGG